MVVESDHPVNGKFTDYITVETGLENLALQLSLLVAFDENRLRNIRLGSLVRTMLDPRATIADPVRGARGGTIVRVLVALRRGITELNLNLESLKPPTMIGFGFYDLPTIVGSGAVCSDASRRKTATDCSGTWDHDSDTRRGGPRTFDDGAYVSRLRAVCQTADRYTVQDPTTSQFVDWTFYTDARKAWTTTSASPTASAWTATARREGAARGCAASAQPRVQLGHVEREPRLDDVRQGLSRSRSRTRTSEGGASADGSSRTRRRGRSRMFTANFDFHLKVSGTATQGATPKHVITLEHARSSTSCTTRRRTRRAQSTRTFRPARGGLVHRRGRGPGGARRGAAGGGLGSGGASAAASFHGKGGTPDVRVWRAGSNDSAKRTQQSCTGSFDRGSTEWVERAWTPGTGQRPLEAQRGHLQRDVGPRRGSVDRGAAPVERGTRSDPSRTTQDSCRFLWDHDNDCGRTQAGKCDIMARGGPRRGAATLRRRRRARARASGTTTATAGRRTLTARGRGPLTRARRGSRTARAVGPRRGRRRPREPRVDGEHCSDWSKTSCRPARAGGPRPRRDRKPGCRRRARDVAAEARAPQGGGGGLRRARGTDAFTAASGSRVPTASRATAATRAAA